MKDNIEKTNQQRYDRIRARATNVDLIFLLITLSITVLGLLTLFSSSSYISANDNNGDELAIGFKQLQLAIAGVIIMMLVSYIDPQLLKLRGAILILGVGAVGLNVLVFTSLGKEKFGARRWLQLAGIEFQPSEVLKLFVIILFAAVCEKYFKTYTKENFFKDFWRKFFFPLIVPLGIVCTFTFLQNHLSATIIIILTAAVIMICGGCLWRHIFLLLPVVAIAGGVMAYLKWDKIQTRWLSWQDPEYDIRGTTYQTYNSMVAIGSGGLSGAGYANSRQKNGYLPEAENDFIFSVACEELGFIGALLIIVLFLLFIWRGFYIAKNSADSFSSLLALGITFHLGLQALLNIAVVSSAFFNTGISLPFFSQGGTALIIQLAECGLLRSVSRKAKLE